MWEGSTTVNFSIHCCLAKFHGLMYQFTKSIAWKLVLGTLYRKLHFSANHSAVFTLVHQTTEFRQTTV